MGTDQEVRENALRASVALRPSPRRVTSEGSPAVRHTDSSNAQSMLIPVSLKNESRKDSLRRGAAINSAKTVAVVTRVPCPSAASKADCAAELRPGSRIPESNNHIRVDSCRHRPRSSRTHRMTSFLPEPIPGFPIPLNFANGLVVLTGRTIPFLSLSNSSLSPGPTLSKRRTSRGTVIWPLLVILACLSNASPLEIPYFIIAAPYFETAAGRWVGARNKLKADCAFGLSRLMSVLRLIGVSPGKFWRRNVSSNLFGKVSTAISHK